MKRCHFNPVLLLFILLAFFCVNTKVWPDGEWHTTSPEEQKINPKPLKQLINHLQKGTKYPNIHGLIIVRNGSIVVEEYFQGYKAEDLHTLQSVSKSFTSAIIGIAIQMSKIAGVQERVLDFFPDYKNIIHRNDKKEKMTLADLLTMRSGTDYHEGYQGSPHNHLNKLRKGWDRFVLNRPMIREPGSKFQYDSGGVILMSSILKRRTGMHADQFAAKYLFSPMNITRVKWFRNQEGHPHTGGGLYLTPRDMAKFGLLYLNGGKWKNRQLVPAAWIRESFIQHVTFSKNSRSYDTGYGYLWWILAPDPGGSGKSPIYAAKGFMGQYIFVIPEHGMVVVVTGGARTGTEQKKPVEFLYSHILPAVH